TGSPPGRGPSEPDGNGSGFSASEPVAGILASWSPRSPVTSQTLAAEPEPQHASQRPSGLSDTLRSAPMPVGTLASCLRSSRSHSLTAPSLPAEANTRLWPAKATAFTGPA